MKNFICSKCNDLIKNNPIREVFWCPESNCIIGAITPNRIRVCLLEKQIISSYTDRLDVCSITFVFSDQVNKIDQTTLYILICPEDVHKEISNILKKVEYLSLLE